MNAVVETGREFWSRSDGKWAGERMLEAMNAGRPLSAKELRINSTLRREEWKVIDTALVEEVHVRLRGIGDLYAAGLTKSIAGGLGKTVYEYDKMSDMTPAIVSMDGNVRSDNDRIDFARAGLPLPITHKDFNLNLRTLLASRSGGEGLDTTQIRICGRLISEKLEDMLFNGSNKVYQGLPIYGYTTFPDRNKVAFGAGGAWTAAAKTGEQRLDDVLTMISAAQADRMFGPYVLYIGAGDSVALEEDFKAGSDKSTRQRLLEIDGLSAIRVSDVLAVNNLLLIQMTADNVQLLVGEPLQNIQWDINGGFTIAFKSFTIQVPLLRGDAAGRSGIVHMNVTGTSFDLPEGRDERKAREERDEKIASGELPEAPRQVRTTDRNIVYEGVEEKDRDPRKPSTLPSRPGVEEPEEGRDLGKTPIRPDERNQDERSTLPSNAGKTGDKK